MRSLYLLWSTNNPLITIPKTLRGNSDGRFNSTYTHCFCHLSLLEVRVHVGIRRGTSSLCIAAMITSSPVVSFPVSFGRWRWWSATTTTTRRRRLRWRWMATAVIFITTSMPAFISLTTLTTFMTVSVTAWATSARVLFPSMPLMRSIATTTMLVSHFIRARPRRPMMTMIMFITTLSGWFVMTILRIVPFARFFWPIMSVPIVLIPLTFGEGLRRRTMFVVIFFLIFLKRIFATAHVICWCHGHTAGLFQLLYLIIFGKKNRCLWWFGRVVGVGVRW